ncbi:MAG: nicotinamide-nucleotide amidohydrolase family protein [bacterium]
MSSDQEHDQFTPGLLVYQIAIGDELLSGRTADTNSGQVQRALLPHGVALSGIRVVADDAAAIESALTDTSRGSLVVLTGGLGSTPDDLSREAVARWAGVELRHDDGVATRLRRLCDESGFPDNEAMSRQAQVPSGLEPLANPLGSAPGLVGELADRLVLMLPGVPSELRAILPLAVDRLVTWGKLPPRRPSLFLRTAQMAEVALAERCQPFRETYPDLRWSWWLGRWGVDLGVSSGPGPAGGARRPDVLPALAAELRELLGPSVYATELKELNEVVQELLIQHRLTVSVAESCTAGLLGARLTELAGSSACFRGGLLAYADEVKRDQLAVPSAVLAEHGAVSGQTAEAMARGCRERFATDLAVAITGIAGPAGGSEAKPVGTTWIAIATAARIHARRYRFPGRRGRNRTLAVSAALDSIRRLVAFPAADSPWSTLDSWGRDS